MLPPMLLYLRVGTPESPGFGMWLPLFLLWLLLLPIMVLALPLTIVADLVLFLAGRRYHHYTLLVLRSFGVLRATRGTTVRIRSNQNVVDITLV
jgi:hypothetical protein